MLSSFRCSHGHSLMDFLVLFFMSSYWYRCHLAWTDLVLKKKKSRKEGSSEFSIRSWLLLTFYFILFFYWERWSLDCVKIRVTHSYCGLWLVTLLRDRGHFGNELWVECDCFFYLKKGHLALFLSTCVVKYWQRYQVVIASSCSCMANN